MTSQQLDALTKAAQDWSGNAVPYLSGGASKDGADCSGSVSAIYAQAAMPIGRMTSGGFANSPLFAPVDGAPAKGDVGWFPGHVVIYAGDLGGGRDVWSASHTGGPVFGPMRSSWFGTAKWYRYTGP
jgi:cell wall-associated NlpC family hydrolase